MINEKKYIKNSTKTFADKNAPETSQSDIKCYKYEKINEYETSFYYDFEGNTGHITNDSEWCQNLNEVIKILTKKLCKNTYYSHFMKLTYLNLSLRVWHRKSGRSLIMTLSVDL